MNLKQLRAALPEAWDGKRPPYGDTDPQFDLADARSLLAEVEHETAPTQDTSDALFVHLRMACIEIEKRQPIIDGAARLIALAEAVARWRDAREVASAAAETPRAYDCFAVIAADRREISAVAHVLDALKRLEDA